jgi:pseudaminic acid synthase
MTQPLAIAGRAIGAGRPPYVIAELSGNHNGRLDRALALVDAAAEAGADAVKLQTFSPGGITLDHDGPDFMVTGGPWGGRTLFDLYSETALPFDWHGPIFVRAAERGLACFSSVFDEKGLSFLDRFDPPAYKIASLELFDLPLIRRVAARGRPMILSTGTAWLGEIEAAVNAARGAGCHDLILLRCTTAYPALAAEAKLAAIPHLAATFGAVVGLSDHTLGHDVATAAVALGAAVIEKHLTLVRADGGADAAFSLEPAEFAALVGAARTAWSAVGEVGYGPSPGEVPALRYRRSLYVVRDMAAGERFTTDTVRSIRPGFGLPPDALGRVLEGRAAMSIARGTALAWYHVAAGDQSSDGSSSG